MTQVKRLSKKYINISEKNLRKNDHSSLGEVLKVFKVFKNVEDRCHLKKRRLRLRIDVVVYY